MFMLRSSKLLTSLILAGVLSACGGSSNNNDTAMDTPVPPPVPPVVTLEYQVTVSNLTNAQPFSPLALVLHQSGEIWQIGQPASLMLETLAESGDNSGVIGADFVVSSASNDGILLPGAQAQVTISTTDTAAAKLSLAAMLVNTNDGFSGFNSVDLSALEVGGMMRFTTSVYDAGTEGNGEMPGTIPGPADGGEGMNEARDDVDYVAMHPGIVSADDGLTLSVLSGEHKFDNPAMSVKIMRIQ
ncbi:MAG: hypothetical protein ACI9FJ_002755 [Alteromonadaceae bacterium]|jgi:hypothetical protein